MNGASNNNTVLECLRGLAALAVCLLHLTALGFGPVPIHFAMVGGLGVDLFFVLSGFLIGRCVLAPVEFRPGEYLVHRSRRILPVYFACLGILMVLVDARQLFERDVWNNFGLHVTLLHGWWEDYSHRINSPFWTLSHEWCFYLLMGLGAPLMRSRYWWLMVAAMIAGAVVCRTYLQAGKIWLANGYQHPICYLDRFAFGLLASKCGLRRQYATLGGAKTLGALMLGGVMLVGWAIWQYYATGVEIPSELLQDMGGAALFFQGVHRNRVHAIIQPLAFSAGLGALLLAAWLKPEPLGRWLRRTPLPWMGKVSYSTYLWHAPILLGLLRAAKRHPGTWMAKPWLALAGILFFVYLISWISYRGFEAPWLKRPKA